MPPGQFQPMINVAQHAKIWRTFQLCFCCRRWLWMNFFSGNCRNILLNSQVKPIEKMLGRLKPKKSFEAEFIKDFENLNFCKSTSTVCIEGNIGSGKSTLLNHFANSPHVEAIKEPLDKWCNLQGHNALELLYKDMKRWSFSFNTYVQLTRVQMHNFETQKPIRMIERSLHSTKHVFMENNRRTGILHEMEYAILDNWYEWLNETKQAEVDLIVYVRAPPEVSYQRITRRDRKEESGVPYEYIEALHELHEDWLIKQKHPVPCPVLVLDASCGLDDLKHLYEDKRPEILCGYH
ncbi:deoxynucleoside kinase [Lingula anatina]|uniref:Deoxynucleoside kinase n=1 Tax=Lingula anatina TaxID=7574 RepID=A0A1S3JE38_LINAN|nr:deoxynucleoside kinase [Lingula anatina]|eukprot:XP_013408593.1 deoxynucleoside kinase [Lingula anatina]